MKKEKKPRYDYQRVEQRKQNNQRIDEKAQRERNQMEKQAKRRRISIGTLTFFKPKPKDRIGEFTLAFSWTLLKSQIYSHLEGIFGNNLSNESVTHDGYTKGVFVKLYTPVPLCEIRSSIRESFKELM